MFLVFFALFALFFDVQADTVVSVPIRLKCEGKRFRYTVKLMEEDGVSAHDVVAQIGGEAEGELFVTLSGRVQHDWPTNDYEFFIKIEHTCTAINKWFYPMRWLTSFVCWDNMTKCEYPEETFDLKIIPY